MTIIQAVLILIEFNVMRVNISSSVSILIWRVNLFSSYSSSCFSCYLFPTSSFASPSSSSFLFIYLPSLLSPSCPFLPRPFPPRRLSHLVLILLSLSTILLRFVLFLTAPHLTLCSLSPLCRPPPPNCANSYRVGETGGWPLQNLHFTPYLSNEKNFYTPSWVCR